MIVRVCGSGPWLCVKAVPKVDSSRRACWHDVVMCLSCPDKGAYNEAEQYGCSRSVYGGMGGTRVKNLLNKARILFMGAHWCAYLLVDLVTILTHCRLTNGVEDNQSSTDLLKSDRSVLSTLVGPSVYRRRSSWSISWCLTVLSFLCRIPLRSSHISQETSHNFRINNVVHRRPVFLLLRYS